MVARGVHRYAALATLLTLWALGSARSARSAKKPTGRRPLVEHRQVNRPLTVAAVLYTELTRANIDTIEATSLSHLDLGQRRAMGVRSLSDIAGDLRQLQQQVAKPAVRWKGNRELRSQVSQLLDGALDLLEKGNGGAASPRLAAAVRRAEQEYREALGAKLQRYGKRKAHDGKYALESPGLHRMYVGNWSDAQVKQYVAPIPTKKRQRMELLWELFRQVDHQLDTEYGYKAALEGTEADPGLLERLRDVDQTLGPLAKAQRHRQRIVPEPGLTDQLAGQLAELETQLKSKWIAHKQLAQRAVGAAGHLVSEGRFGPAQSLVAVAQSLLEVRAGAVNDIIANLEQVRREDLREAARARTAGLDASLQRLETWVRQGFKARRSISQGLDRLLAALRRSSEPDEELLRPILSDLRFHFRQVLNARGAREAATLAKDPGAAQRAENHISKHYRAALAQLDAGRRRLEYAMGLHDFMVTYRSQLKVLRLAGRDQLAARDEAFESSFQAFMVEQDVPSTMGERTAREHHLWRIKAYQAVFESPRMDNSAKGGARRIPNPRFAALSLYFELCARNDIGSVLSNRRILPARLRETRAHLSRLRKELRRERLFADYPADPVAASAGQRGDLERALLRDYQLDDANLLPTKLTNR